MGRVSVVVISLLLCAFSFVPALAQVDDVSEVTGMPIPIGAPVIYGQVLIRNLPKGERRPIIYVYLRNGGAQIDKFQATEQGYYYFLKRPIDGHTITFEVEGSEIGRAIIAGGVSNRFRQDVEFDWNSLHGASRNPSQSNTVISARDRYDRGADADKIFDKAMSAVKAGKNDEAIKIFDQIVAKDPKDFVAFMMLGTIHGAEKRDNDARKAFQSALDLKPDFLMALLNYGRMELANKSFDHSIELLSKAVEVEPTSVDGNHYLGEAYLQAKKGSKAVVYLNKAIDLAPVEMADLHLRLAALYDAAGYKDRAAAEYKAYIKKVPDYKDKKKLEDYINKNAPPQ